MKIKNMNQIKNILKSKKFYYLFFSILILLSLRNLFLPLQGDEITYNKIAQNVLSGRYYQNENPTSVIPIIPFLMAFFSTAKWPIIGFALHKTFHILICILGLRFAFLTFKKLNLDSAVIYTLMLSTCASSGFLSFLPSLYPEAIVFVSFWGFIYYLTSEKTIANFKRLFILFILLVFTRYVYAILGLVLLIYYYSFYISNKKNFKTIVLYSIILSTPLLFWFKYVYNIESQNLSEISYFSRYKMEENPLWYNIKCGLGLEQHHQVNRINGVPAFISLFIPITGIRNFTISLVLLFAVFFGLYKYRKNDIIKQLSLIMGLSFLGFVLAGTGFSRYWLVLLPIIYLSFYYLYSSYIKKTDYFIYAFNLISLILVLNEMRITLLLINKIA
jgi:hypothetical protein